MAKRKAPDRFRIERLTIYLPKTLLDDVNKLADEIEDMNRSEVVVALIGSAMGHADEIFPLAEEEEKEKSMKPKETKKAKGRGK